MEKITKEQFDETEWRLRSKNPLVHLLNQVEVDEGVKILKSEWELSTDPPSYVGQSFRGGRSTKKFKSHFLSDRSGWIILRIK